MQRLRGYPNDPKGRLFNLCGLLKASVVRAHLSVICVRKERIWQWCHVDLIECSFSGIASFHTCVIRTLVHVLISSLFILPSTHSFRTYVGERASERVSE